MSSASTSDTPEEQAIGDTVLVSGPVQLKWQSKHPTQLL
jgi:hypothetical protein